MDAEEAPPPPPPASDVPPPPLGEIDPSLDPAFQHAHDEFSLFELAQQPQLQPPPPFPHSEGSSSDHSDDEGEQQPRAWQPITEDTSVPCADELDYIIGKGEHSALDNEYWEKEAFFDLRDPELVPGESGRIDWLVEAFNGTKDKPNTEMLMRSPVVRIGGLDWQIKFYPKGNSSQYLSLYVECVSMLEQDYPATEDFQHPPFPFLEGAPQQRKRRSVAAQLLVVMYNPAEPRVYEVQSEAHQFQKKQADYGWVYFSRYPRSEFHQRQHTQRQAILRGDQLAFRAFIRIVDDPTGSMWGHHPTLPEEIVSLTGLRPFKKSLHYISGVVPLLHFAPFRKIVQDLPSDTPLARWLQPLLIKMYTRQLSLNYNIEPFTIQEGDVMENLMKIAALFQSDAQSARQWNNLIHTVHGVSSKEYTSIQEAVDNCKASLRPLLILELTRQEHDKKTRKWTKLTNMVRLDDHIDVQGSRYTLFAVVTHCGHLLSSRYKSYVRPNGVGKGWYGYQDGLVTRLTEKQARDRHSEPDTEDETCQSGHDSPFSGLHEPESEVSSVVMYIQDDVATETFNASAIETWNPPSTTVPLEEKEHREAVEGHPDVMADEAAGESTENPLQRWFDREAGAATPGPTSKDGEDTIMRDADSTSAVNDSDSTGLTRATYSWLGRCYYDGQWQNGEFHGGGHHIDTNGDEYLGKFENGLKHGYGKMVYAASGDVYDGNWKEGVHHGTGTLTELSSGNVFEGSWLEGRKHGSFVLKGTVTEEDKSCCTICYEREMSTAFYDCGHVVACRECAAQIVTCPVCRRRVAATLQLYGVKLLSH